jgi:hypothetical protein
MGRQGHRHPSCCFSNHGMPGASLHAGLATRCLFVLLCCCLWLTLFFSCTIREFVKYRTCCTKNIVR